MWAVCRITPTDYPVTNKGMEVRMVYSLLRNHYLAKEGSAPWSYLVPVMTWNFFGGGGRWLSKCLTGNIMMDKQQQENVR